MENKKIINYKLIKPEYIQAVKEILVGLLFDSNYESNKIDNPISINRLKIAGVLNLWFEPVYEIEPQFKENEWLCCNSGNSIALLRYNGINNSAISTKEYYQINSEQELISSGKSNLYCLPENTTYATSKQIQEILTIVAKHKGFIEGIKFKSSLSNQLSMCINNFEYDIEKDILYNDDICVYNKGKWGILIEKSVELVKSWEDAFNGEGYWIDSDSIIFHTNELKTKGFKKNIFRTKAQAKSALAFAQLLHIVTDANGDWIVDWKNNEDKFVINYQENKAVIEIWNNLIQPLPMKSEEIAKACLEKHRTLWEDFWMINK